MPPPDDGLHGAAGSPGLIDCYELIAQASHEMLAASRADDWESVTRLEDACRALIDQVRRDACDTRLSEVEQARRIALLRSILADDAQIRERSEPWLQQLEHMIGTSGALRRLARLERG
jgi:flagellar protein FliT